MNVERKIGAKGGITLPAHLRRDLGIQGKEKISIEPQDNGDILVKRINGSCIFCSSVEDVEAFKGKFVCKECKKELRGE